MTSCASRGSELGSLSNSLAIAADIPRETIARWETGAREPSLSSLRKLAEASNLDLVIHLSQRDGLTVVVAAPDDILRSKEACGREKDRAALPQMREDFRASGAL